MSFTVSATFATAQEAANFLAGVGAPQTTETAKTEVKTTPKPKAVAAASAEPAQSPVQQPAADAKASAEPETPKVKAVDYPTLQKKVFELAAAVQKKGIDTAEWVVSIAKKHGGDNFKALKPESYAAALADVTEQIAKVAALEESVA